MHVSVTKYAIHDYYGKIGNKTSIESTYIRNTIERAKNRLPMHFKDNISLRQSMSISKLRHRNYRRLISKTCIL